jgi:hypothetical protein
MTTTLSEGVIVPDVGDVNWAGKLEVNWNLLNGALANLSGNVKLDRDNTWTGEQSFTLPIVGSITGTASKAIADEDGNAIKSSYGKLAGANTWTQTQTFQSNINLTNTSYTIGTIPSTTAISACYFAGATNSQFGYCRAIVYKTTGLTSIVLAARNRFTNGALSPTGAYVNATFTVNLDADGTGWIQFEDCSIKNDLIPYTTDTYNIGTSTKKWKTLNGVNPGALSLPDFTSETGVSLSAGANTYTPVLSGWLSISTTGDISVVCGNFCHKATDMISVPVIAGKTYTVTMPSAATGYFYACQGNV